MTIKTTVNFILLMALIIAGSARSQEPIEYSVLAIAYIGESDKPVFPVLISDSRAGLSWYRDAVLKGNEFSLIYAHVVSVCLMAKLIVDAENHQGSAQHVQANQSKSPPTVSITLVTPHARNTFLLNTKPALALLKDLKKLCAADKSLQADLSHFMNRIVQLNN